MPTSLPCVRFLIKADFLPWLLSFKNTAALRLGIPSGFKMSQGAFWRPSKPATRSLLWFQPCPESPTASSNSPRKSHPHPPNGKWMFSSPPASRRQSPSPRWQSMRWVARRSHLPARKRESSQAVFTRRQKSPTSLHGRSANFSTRAMSASSPDSKARRSRGRSPHLDAAAPTSQPSPLRRLSRPTCARSTRMSTAFTPATRVWCRMPKRSRRSLTTSFSKWPVADPRSCSPARSNSPKNSKCLSRCAAVSTTTGEPS